MERKLTSIQRRLIDAAGSIMVDPAERPDYLHSVLCQVGMPRKRTAGTEFHRTNGGVSLRVEAGQLWNGMEWIQQPLPYGTRPRLALVHVSSEAIRTKSRTIEVGDSVREFLLRLGLDDGGREYKRFQQQMMALAASRMLMGIGGDTVDLKPIRSFQTWQHPTGEQRTLWPGVLELSADFYETLVERAVPLDARALTALAHSALALDCYTWLAHRLHRIERADGVTLSWANLKDQFGQEYKDLRDFKRVFRTAMRAALTVYPSARINLIEGHVVLHASPPPVTPTTISVKALPSM